MPLPPFCQPAFVATSLALLAVRGAIGAPKLVPPTVAVLPSALPRSQRLRINDTLVLVVSRPYGTFTTYDRSTPTWLWQRAELRGRRGYRQQLTDGRGDDLCTLYGARAGAGGTLLRLSFWRDSHDLPPRHPATPLIENDDAFACLVWDVRYRTWGWFYNADLAELGARNDGPPGFTGMAFGFTGGFYEGCDERGLYYLLPHWIAAEQARVRRTHRLPPPARLAAYLEQAEGHDRLRPAYRPLLARLLRAYAACPPPPAAVARRLAAARRALVPRPLAH